MPNHPMYHSQVLDHLGLVAGMFDALGIGEVLDQATKQNPEMRDLPVGEAVKAMVLNGLGFVNHALYLVPKFFHNKPTYRLIAPRVASGQLHDDALGRAVDTLYTHGVTALYRLLAVKAAKCLGLTPTFAHLDTTSVHVDGRYNSAQAPDAQVVPITRGYSRDHRSDVNQVMLEWIVEHQAGSPVLRQPLSGNSSDGPAFGQVVKDHMAPLHTTYGMTYVVADSALSSDENLQELAKTQIKWITRVPATLREAQAALAQADPPAMQPLTEGYRYPALPSTSGDVEQRWLLIASEPRQLQARRTVAQQLLKHSAQAIKAWKQLCGTAFACEADAQQALARFAQGLQATFLSTSRVRAQPRSRTRGRPGRDAQPDQVFSQVDGALASSLAARQGLLDQHRCFILATKALAETQRAAHEVLHGDKGQQHAERGFRFLKDPPCLAASLYLKKPERIMALLMVMTVCLFVYAAVEYRIRKALKAQEATFPDQKGTPTQTPTARWVFHDFVGIHLRCQAGQWPVVLNLTEEHQNLLRLLGQPYMRLYDVKYS